MRIPPSSVAFTLLLGLLATLPTFGIDMILPALPAMGAALGAPISAIGVALFSVLAAIAYFLIARPAERAALAALVTLWRKGHLTRSESEMNESRLV